MLCMIRDFHRAVNLSSAVAWCYCFLRNFTLQPKDQRRTPCRISGLFLYVYLHLVNCPTNSSHINSLQTTNSVLLYPLRIPLSAFMHWTSAGQKARENKKLILCAFFFSPQGAQPHTDWCPLPKHICFANCSRFIAV